MESKMNTKIVTIDTTIPPLPKPRGTKDRIEYAEKGEFLSLFPTPAVKTNIGRGFTKDETDFIQNISMQTKKRENHQSQDAYLFDTFIEELKDIKNFCEYHLKQYLENIEGANTDLAGLRITQSWLNKNKPQEHQHLHHHGNSYLSGILYVSCLPDDCINIINRLYRPYNNMNFPMKEITEWNTQGTKISVKEGDLLLFPSWIPHYVDKNNTDKERISLAFNTFPIGEMGDYYGSHLKL